MKLLAAKHHSAELPFDGRQLIFHRLIDKVSKLCHIIKRHTRDTYLRKEVVLPYLTPELIAVIVPASIESRIVQVGRNIVTRDMASSRKDITIKSTIRHNAYIASEKHHHNVVITIFSDDEVSYLLLIISTLHRRIDRVERDDACPEISV